MDAEPIMRRSDYATAIEDEVKNARRFLDLTKNKDREIARAAEMRQRAQELLASADRIEAEASDAKELYIRTTERIAKLRSGLAILEQDSKLNTIAKLANDLAALDPALLEQAMAKLEEMSAAQKGAQQ